MSIIYFGSHINVMYNLIIALPTCTLLVKIVIISYVLYNTEGMYSDHHHCH